MKTKQNKKNRWDIIKFKACVQQRKPQTKWKGNQQNGNKYLKIKGLRRD